MAAPLGQALAEDQAGVGEAQQVLHAGCGETWIEGVACVGASHVVHFDRAACRRSGGGRPCLPPDRSTCPCRPGRWRRSGRSARPTRWCLPGGACRRRARAGSPSARRPRAGCRSACGRGPPCCARTLPTAAIRLHASSSARCGVRVRWAHAASRCVLACAHGPAPPRAPRRRRPRPSTRAARRSRLHGPSPPTTRQNSLQSIAPKS